MVSCGQCSKSRRRLSGVAGRPKFNQLDHLYLVRKRAVYIVLLRYTYVVSLREYTADILANLYLQTQFGVDRCTQFRVIVVTDPPTHKQTGPITIHCAAASAQCNENKTALAEVITYNNITIMHPCIARTISDCQGTA